MVIVEGRKTAEHLKKQSERLLRTAMNDGETDLLEGVPQPIGSYVEHSILKPSELLSNRGGRLCACVLQVPHDLFLQAVLGASPGLVADNLRRAHDNGQRQQQTDLCPAEAKRHTRYIGTDGLSASTLSRGVQTGHRRIAFRNDPCVDSTRTRTRTIIKTSSCSENGLSMPVQDEGGHSDRVCGEAALVNDFGWDRPLSLASSLALVI